jgi:hypoxanthine phosphoribosyltransferase
MVQKTKKHIIIYNYKIDEFLVDLEGLGFMKICCFKNIDSIYAIPRGGYIFGVFLSHLFKLPMVNKPTKNTLIVDDICDTGKTFSKYKKYLKICLVIKDKGAKCTDNIIYGKRVKDNVWIKFFWEVE